jgi:hypothetical protein
MLSLDQIEGELKAIRDFDILFLARREHHREEIVGFELRKLRKQELLELAKSQRALKGIRLGSRSNGR